MRPYVDFPGEFSNRGTIDADPSGGQDCSGPRSMSSSSTTNSVQKPCLAQRSKSVNGRLSFDFFDDDDRDCKSLPSSPSPTKKVHFADSEGLNLVDVKNFVPSTDDLSALHRACKAGRGHVRSRQPDSFLDCLRGDFLAKVGVHSLKVCFEMPSLRHDFLDCVRRQHVCLESVSVQDRTLTGIVVVENLAFEKTVTVRYSLDEWRSFSETLGNYIPNSSTGNTDRFLFVITVPRRSKSVEFAIRFSISGQEFWDNNHGRNYRLQDAISA